MKSNPPTKNTLQELVGEEMSSITFIEDYIQFGFNGATLTFYTFPTVMKNGLAYDADTYGYRDVICSFISEQIVHIEEIEKKSIKIEFKNLSYIELNIEDCNYIGPEIAMFTNKLNQIIVW